MEHFEGYLSGLATSLPVDVNQFLRTIPGLENVEVMRAGYAISMTVLIGLLNTYLQVKSIKGLFSAGQINGSSGCRKLLAKD